MSLSKAFGPAPKKNSDGAAILGVRTAIYARLGPGHAYRSPLSIALLYAAELSLGDAPPKRRKKLEAARAQLAELDADEISVVLDVVRELIADLEDGSPSHVWAKRCESVLTSLPAALAVVEAARARRAAEIIPHVPGRFVFGAGRPRGEVEAEVARLDAEPGAEPGDP